MEQIPSHKRYLFQKPRPPGKQIFSVSLQTKQNSLICFAYNRKKNTYYIEGSIARENNKIGFIMKSGNLYSHLSLLDKLLSLF